MPTAWSCASVDGVNYRANLWLLNGQLVADNKHIIGAYRGFEFDISERVDRAGVNAIALEIEVPTSCELAITWVDWNPSPPDKNMGIWKDVWLHTSGPVANGAPHVVTQLTRRRSPSAPRPRAQHAPRRAERCARPRGPRP